MNIHNEMLSPEQHKVINDIHLPVLFVVDNLFVSASKSRLAQCNIIVKTMRTIS